MAQSARGPDYSRHELRLSRYAQDCRLRRGTQAIAVEGEGFNFAIVALRWYGISVERQVKRTHVAGFNNKAVVGFDCFLGGTGKSVFEWRFAVSGNGDPAFLASFNKDGE